MEEPGAARVPGTSDPGVAHERTALAWRRTVLAIVVAAALLARLVVDRLGAAGIVAVIVTFPVGVSVFWRTGRPSPRPPAANAALIAAAVTVLAAVEAGALASEVAGG